MDSRELTGLELWDGPVVDEVTDNEILESVERFSGRVWSIQTDTVQIGGHVAKRDYVRHTGAVAVIPMDDRDRIFLIRQYRHPIGMFIFEPPAGLLDVVGEDPLLTGKRELAEEAGLEARQWDVLVDFYNSPGGSSESLRIYLARKLSVRRGGRIMTGEAEEASLPGVWIDLDDAVSLVLKGDVGGPTTVIGVLATHAQRARNYEGLRDANSPWPLRDHLLATNRVGRRTDKD